MTNGVPSFAWKVQEPVSEGDDGHDVQEVADLAQLEHRQGDDLREKLMVHSDFKKWNIVCLSHLPS